MSEDVNSSQGGQRSGPGSGTNLFRGGLLIALAALALLALTYSIPDSLIPRIMAIVIAVIGVATAAGFVPVRAPQDYYGGLVLVMLATLALIASSDLPGQRGFAFGPGTAPRLFAGILVLFGGAVAVVGVVSDGPPIEKYKLRGPVFVLLAICLFAAIIRPFGLVVSSYVVFMISVMGSKETRWIEAALAAAAMTGGCVLLFVYLLNLPFHLWPVPNAHVLLGQQFAEFFRLVFGPLMKFLGVM
ncbi:MAG: tripartite tricarboxylate transporter TctB family protein [Xanthobacteraceae bacterium]